jgi:hypothetical protein
VPEAALPFGRTNRILPAVWFWLEIPTDREAAEGMAAALGGSPADVSASPGYWGPLLRGCDSPVVIRGRSDFERAASDEDAFGAVQADIIAALSALGRTEIDFFALPIRRALEERQIEGALRALEDARTDGLIRHPSLLASGPALAVRSVWQFHDAFEALFCDAGPEAESLAPLARSRRVGLCIRGGEGGDAVMIRVASRGQIEEARS